MMDCEPIEVTDDDLSGELFALALQANAGNLSFDEVMAEAFWWHNLHSADLETIDVDQRDRGFERT